MNNSWCCQLENRPWYARLKWTISEISRTISQANEEDLDEETESKEDSDEETAAKEEDSDEEATKEEDSNGAMVVKGN